MNSGQGRNSQLSSTERVFVKHVAAHLKEFAKIIDVTRFIKVNHWDIDRILDLYEEALWDSPEIFYVSKHLIRIRFTRNADDSIRYAKLYGIKYVFPQEEYREAKIKFDAEVKKAVAYAGRETAPEKIARRLHDYLIWTCEYDSEALSDKTASLLARSVYSVLVRKKAVCEGYTMAYRYLLKMFGIPCEEILSPKMRHCWNYVKIRNHWYHADVTFDDPVFVDEYGRRVMQPAPVIDPGNISHRFFLLSDAALLRTGHFGWNTKGLPPASDETYDDRVWS
ncbi:MAG: hypothetical protein IJS14_08195 [Lentisphaeria bacterium]|nr:hypothetical protein [Lentisphaeria bacterium]